MKSIKLFFPFRIMLPLIAVLIMSLSSCYIYSTQEAALVKNVDIDQTLKVAFDELQKKDISESMGIWVMKDQIVTPLQARTISEMYLSHIDNMNSEFNIWHSSWAISNLYRFGSDLVKAELEVAYQKAKLQPERLDEDLKATANEHINGKKMVTGFIHIGGLSYAYEHLVVPGNNKYIQSYEEYLENQKD